MAMRQPLRDRPQPGDDVVVLPSEATHHDGPYRDLLGELAEAYPPMSVVVHLTDDPDVGRGDLLARVANQPRSVRTSRPWSPGCAVTWR